MKKRRPSRTGCAGFSWENAFELIKPHLPGELLTPEQFDRARWFARGLPGLWHWGILEVRLASNQPAVDLLGMLSREEVPKVRLQHALQKEPHPALASAIETTRTWLRDDGNLVSRSPTLWFEWDRDGAEHPPLLWLCIAPEFLDTTLRPLAPREIAEIVQSFVDTDDQLQVPAASETVGKLAETLPHGGKLMAFASLRPRGRQACRLFVQLPRGGTMPWLREIGWNGDWSFLRSTRHLFDVKGENEWCQIEFGPDGLGKYVAIEPAQTTKAFSEHAARRKLLEEIIERGWACPERARAVLRWQGRKPVRLSSGRPVFLQRTFHLKLATAGVGVPQAKAYLGFCCRRVAMTAKSAPPRLKRMVLRAS